MIITVTTIVVLVIGALSLALAVYGGTIANSIIEDSGNVPDSDSSAEKGYYLLGMIGLIVLSARILIVPIFFWMLQTLVPYCPGAMCASGVVNVAFPYSVGAIATKIFVPFTYGLWIVLELSNRKQARLPLNRMLAMFFLYLILPLLFIDSALDLLVVAAIRPISVPCCSSVYDVNPPFSPSSFLGPEMGFIILGAAIVFSLMLSGIQWFESTYSNLKNLSFLLASLSAFLYFIALHDTYAPIVLGLSTHHCPYCLFQEFPDTAFFSILFWIGIVTAAWRLLLEKTVIRFDISVESISGMVSSLRKVSSISLLFSMVSMLAHLSVAL
ncbi:MAG: membrane protein of unknown function [Candidatus Thorarchaeota archaeon]|nr:MAG: membrane protein of unknown function [Candidatus Thorarchaeota archaeon]